MAQLRSYDDLVSQLGYPAAAQENDKEALGAVLDRSLELGLRPK